MSHEINLSSYGKNKSFEILVVLEVSVSRNMIQYTETIRTFNFFQNQPYPSLSPLWPWVRKNIEISLSHEINLTSVGENESFEISVVLEDPMSKTIWQYPETIRTFIFLQMYPYPSLFAMYE